MMKPKPDHPISPLIANRHSPRAMSGEEISDEEIRSLFEAARWAPSSYNNQPWRFIYAKKNTSHWNTHFSLLGDFNRKWCANAALLCVVCGKTTFDKTGKPSVTYAFDTGSAWENLAIEGCARGLVVHGMQGFDYEKAKAELRIPDDWTVLAMFAVGKKGALGVLPPELQEKETPSTRHPLSHFVFEGRLK